MLPKSQKNNYNGLPKAIRPSMETYLYLQMDHPCSTQKEIWLKRLLPLVTHEWGWWEVGGAGTKGLTTCLVPSLIWKFFHLSTWSWDSEQRRPCNIPWYIVDAQQIFINFTFNVFVIFFNKISPDVLNLWMTYLRHPRLSYGNCFPVEETCSCCWK